MSQWSLTERLQPSLLDRLTDEEPDKKKERQGEAFLGQSELKKAVIRDLSYLLNCVSFEAVFDLSEAPRVQDSVINYGIPDLSGHSAESLDIADIESRVRRAIHRFEPRLIRNALKVRIEANRDEMSQNSMVFRIEGSIFGQPAPFQVQLHTEIDLENGDVTVREDY